MKKIIYGVGVGPGDPELMTLKAVRILTSCDVIGIPAKDLATCTAYKIALAAIPALEEKEKLFLPTPMTKDPDALHTAYTLHEEKLLAILDKDKTVGILTLGDPSVYSTFVYMAKRLKAYDVQMEMISGVPSFCAAASRFATSLGERQEPIFILPGSYPMEELLPFPGTKVIMKSGSQIGEVKHQLAQSGHRAVMVENCGMSTEKCYHSLDEIPESSGYFSLIIAKPDND